MRIWTTVKFYTARSLPLKRIGTADSTGPAGSRWPTTGTAHVFSTIGRSFQKRSCSPAGSRLTEGASSCFGILESPGGFSPIVRRESSAGDFAFQANHRAIDRLLDPSVEKLIRYFQEREAPDEALFHTVLCNHSDLQICKDTKRYADWSIVDPHPKWLDVVRCAEDPGIRRALRQEVPPGRRRARVH